MPDANDMDLVREFARDDSEPAFAELVRRHINLVYSVALRCTGSPEDAQDVTQAVFIILAQKATGLRERTVLTGWLYETTRFTSAKLLRTKTRRAAREQEAFMQSTLNEPDTDGIWRLLAPHLEEAMGRLAERDRTLLALRFYENKTGAEASALLGIGEDAAHKRTARALEKLRTFFSKRGVTLTATVIASAVSANSVQAAPAGLAVTVTMAAAKGAAVGGSTLTLVKGALKLMAWTKAKTAIVVGVSVLLAAGTIVVTTTLVKNANPPALVTQHELQHSEGIPYKMADDFWQLLNDVNTNKLEVHLTITSAVKPTDIHIIIQSAVKGPIFVTLGTNGQVNNFPHDEVLRRENPTVMVNQRHGNFTVSASMPIGDELTFRYNRLRNCITETSNVIAKANKIIRPSYVGWLNYIEWLFSPTLKVQGIVFEFPKSSARKATVEIMAAAGTKTYRADANGQIKLKLDTALFLENPEVKISEKPQFIKPNMQL